MSIHAAQLGPHRSIAVRWIRIVATLIVLTVPFLAPIGTQAQDVPPLRGEVLVGDSALDSGTVVLHQVTSESQGEIDSVGVAPDGSFVFTLPEAPLGAADRFYFASIRHRGILYFGSALADVAQLDSIYRIQAYDTAMVASGGHDVPIQARNLFFEPNGEEWRVTDIFQLRNDEGRTLVAPEDGFVWRYPLVDGAREFSSGQDGFSLDGTTVEGGDVVVRAAIAPGERVFVFRYTVDEIFGSVPTPGLTETFDLLVREPSPRVGVEGLDLIGRVELEAGSTYRRYSAVDVGPDRVRLVEAETPGDLPVEWITVVVALALAVAAIVVLRGFSSAEAAGDAAGAGSGVLTGGAGGGSAVADRQAVLMEVARLDEAFEAQADPTEDERATYERRRAELLGRLRAGS